MIARFGMGIAWDKNDIPYHLYQRKEMERVFLTGEGLRGMDSEGGEVKQSSVSTRGKTHLPVVRIKLQRVLSRLKRSVKQKRAHFTQWCPVGVEKLSSAKGQTSIVCFLTL